MEVNQNILDFINYQYVPFSKKQCGCRILYLWLASVVLCLLPPHKPSWFFCIFSGTVFVSGVFIYIMVKLANKQTSRFLCDGLYCLYLSILLTMAAYRINPYMYGYKVLKLVLFLLGLLVCVGLFLLLTFKNIKNGKFGTQSKSSIVPFIPYLFGFLGISFGKMIFPTLSEQQGTELFSLAILFLAYLVSIPSLQLLKFILAVRMDKQKAEDGSI